MELYSIFNFFKKLKLIFCIFIFKVNEVEAIRNAKEWTRLYALQIILELKVENWESFSPFFIFLNEKKEIMDTANF